MRSALAWCLLLAACSLDNGPDVVTTQLTVQGRVVEFGTDTPIPNAVARLGVGGHFSLPIVLDSATADAQGNFSLSWEANHQRGSCGYWVGARAAGFVTSDPAFDVVALHCVTSPQTVEVALKRPPSPQ